MHVDPETTAPKGVEVDHEEKELSAPRRFFKFVFLFGVPLFLMVIGVLIYRGDEAQKVRASEMEKFLKIEAVMVSVQGDMGVRSGPAPFMAMFAVNFAAKAADGDPWAYQWSFGDGATSKEVAPQHTFKKPAEYTVRVIVTDDKGRTAEKEVRIVVSGPPDGPAAPKQLLGLPDMSKGLDGGLASLKTVFFGKAKEAPRPPDGIVRELRRGGQGFKYANMAQGSRTDWFLPAESGKGLVFRAEGPGVQEAEYYNPPGWPQITYVRFYNKELAEPSDIVVVLD